jgi:hypothetical protein
MVRLLFSQSNMTWALTDVENLRYFLLRPRLLKPQSGESSFIYATKTL